MTPAGPVGLAVRPMRRDDIQAISRIEADRHSVDAWSSTAFHDALDRPDSYLCVVVAASPDLHDQRGGGGADGDGVIAYGVVSLVGDVADLDNLTVRADHERRGIGRWLLGLLLEAAERRGAREVLLEVRHDNDPAVGLYTTAGFVEISRRRGYYTSGMEAIVMRRGLGAGPAPAPVGSTEVSHG